MKRLACFCRDRIKRYGISSIILGGISTAASIVGLIDYFSDQSNDCLVLWSVAIVLFVFSIFGVLNYAFYTQSILKDEVIRCAKAKSELEHEVLKKRKSSSKRKS